MIATYDLTKDDYLAFIQHLQSGAVARSKMRSVLWLILSLVYVLLLSGYVYKQNLRVDSSYLLMPALVNSVVVLLALAYIATVSKRMSRTLQSDEYCDAYCGRRELVLAADELVEQKNSSTLRHPLSSVERIVQSKHYLFVHSPAHVVSMIPRRAFATDDEFQALAQTIASHSGVALERKL